MKHVGTREQKTTFRYFCGAGTKTLELIQKPFIQNSTGLHLEGHQGTKWWTKIITALLHRHAHAV